MKRKHGLFLFIASCVPGCGQMYQGYMKRGLSLMLACCALISFSICLYLDFLLVFLVPLWLYAFFDSYNLRSFIEQDAPLADEYLFGLDSVDAERLSTLFRKRNSLLGWVLVLLGVYILFDTFVGRLMQRLCEYLGDWWLYDIVMRDLPRILVTIGIIALGVWFIRGPKRAPAEEIPIFTPPAEDSAQEAPAEEDSHGEH